MFARKLIALLVVALFGYVASPLLIPVTMGGVLAALVWPLLLRLEQRKLPTWLASAILTVSMTLLFLLPITLLAFFGIRTGLMQIRAWKARPGADTDMTLVEKLIEVPVIRRLVERVSAWFPVSIEDIISSTSDAATNMSRRLADVMAGFLSHIPAVAMGFVILVLAMYFFLADGRKFGAIIRRNRFFSAKHTELLMRTFTGMCRSVILASVVSGFAQAALFTLGCLVVGRDNALLFGVFVFLASFVPLVGSFPVTLSVALHTLFTQSTGAGVALLILAGVVSVIDNFIRPMVIKGTADLHPLLAFIAAFGGLQTIGVLGIFLGPIIAGLFVVMVQILLTGDNEV